MIIREKILSPEEDALIDFLAEMIAEEVFKPNSN
jgi:hypothetical protein